MVLNPNMVYDHTVDPHVTIIEKSGNDIAPDQWFCLTIIFLLFSNLLE